MKPLPETNSRPIVCARLDSEKNKLQQLNSDYEAKRYKDITLQHLEVIQARAGLFNDWLKSRGKLGGQHKVPRLSNSRTTMEQLLRFADTPQNIQS